MRNKSYNVARINASSGRNTLQGSASPTIRPQSRTHHCSHPSSRTPPTRNHPERSEGSALKIAARVAPASQPAVAWASLPTLTLRQRFHGRGRRTAPCMTAVAVGISQPGRIPAISASPINGSRPRFLWRLVASPLNMRKVNRKTLHDYLTTRALIPGPPAPPSGLDINHGRAPRSLVCIPTESGVTTGTAAPMTSVMLLPK